MVFTLQTQQASRGIVSKFSQQQKKERKEAIVTNIDIITPPSPEFSVQTCYVRRLPISECDIVAIIPAPIYASSGLRPYTTSLSHTVSPHSSPQEVQTYKWKII